jgi:phytoene dehydrogenase-like protein
VPPDSVDAIVIGAGPNGLVAANHLADAGWSVAVLEAADTPGGAVRSAEVTVPGFRSDLFSAFYPMTAASPVIKRLGLERWGLEWTHAPAVVSNPLPGEPAAVLWRDAERTAARLDERHPGDGEAWLALQARWDRYGQPFLDAMLSPFPPVRSTVRLAATARMELVELARLAVLPVRRLAEESFRGPQAATLYAGNALHADLTPESAPSALLGWMLVSLAQTVGFPVPVGGAQCLTDALVTRLRAAGGDVHCGMPAATVDIRGGRAVGVTTADGTAVAAKRAVIAACDAEVLYRRLLPEDALPPSFRTRFTRFQRGSGTVKVDWALERPIPWTDPDVGQAGTVHVTDGMDELTVTSSQLAAGVMPDRPFLLVGQMTTTDASRSPAGTESAWAYTHVPQGPLDGDELQRFVDTMEQRIEDRAPGFRSCIRGRYVQGPGAMERANPSLVGGDIAGGTTQLHQQLVFRPVPGLGRAETPIPRLYLGSASAHPGGSVHGACGANAARAALTHERMARAAVVATALGALAALPRGRRR